MIDSKNEKIIYFNGTNIKWPNLDIYGKENALMLAKIVPEFKTWLIDKGWTEADFK